MSKYGRYLRPLGIAMFLLAMVAAGYHAARIFS